MNDISAEEICAQALSPELNIAEKKLPLSALLSPEGWFRSKDNIRPCVNRAERQESLRALPVRPTRSVVERHNSSAGIPPAMSATSARTSRDVTLLPFAQALTSSRGIPEAKAAGVQEGS
jgi:hypothetical protein